MKIDKRTKFGKFYTRWCNKYTRSALILGLMTGTLIGLYLADRPRKPIEQTIIPKVEEVKAFETPFCYNVISCIRDVGEELGFSNKDIMIAIRISKAESGLRADAIGKNSNGTFDIGAMQINDVHNKRISRADRLDFEKNIRFAYKLRAEQGNWNAWSTCHNGKVDCRL